MILAILLLLLGLFLVVKSADWFLAATEKIGTKLNIPQFIMGVVLVGFGTSLPEFSTSIASIIQGEHTITIANITGSNIANIFLVLGLTALIMGTIKFKKDLIDLDIPLLIAITMLFSILIADGTLTQLDGGILLVAFVGYLLYSIGYNETSAHHHGIASFISSTVKTLSQKKTAKKNPTKDPIHAKTIALLVGSVIILGISSKLVVDNLLVIVQNLNIAVSILSFFALAIGTSLPELIVSIKSLREGKSDLVVGNIIGSCMFNILLIGGFAGVLHPQTVDTNVVIWMITGLLGSVLLLAIGSISKRIHVWEGLALVLLYGAISLKLL